MECQMKVPVLRNAPRMLIAGHKGLQAMARA